MTAAQQLMRISERFDNTSYELRRLICEVAWHSYYTLHRNVTKRLGQE